MRTIVDYGSKCPFYGEEFKTLDELYDTVWAGDGPAHEKCYYPNAHVEAETATEIYTFTPLETNPQRIERLRRSLIAISWWLRGRASTSDDCMIGNDIPWDYIVALDEVIAMLKDGEIGQD